MEMKMNWFLFRKPGDEVEAIRALRALLVAPHG